ncbi:MAG TPA: hypothetical protein VH561_05105 [Micromonosporaceae bacterium]
MSTLAQFAGVVMVAAQPAVTLLSKAVRLVAEAAPEPSPSPSPNLINTSGVVNFITTKVVPILLAVLGVVFISRAGKGEMSKVLTSSAIAMIGLAFIVGAGALFFFGQGLVELIFGTAK